jgi:hypothetical protein
VRIIISAWKLTHAFVQAAKHNIDILTMMEKYTEEILSVRTKEVIAYGAGYTDKVEMISEELARIVYLKALVYRIECNVSQTEEGHEYSCHSYRCRHRGVWRSS